MTTRDYLVIDLEATCDDAGAVPRREMEIIEIGAVLVDGQTLCPKREFQRFVRPLRHRTLTPFCRQLTSITQAEVDGAATFPEVIAELRAFMYDDGGRPRFCSWGAYDRGQFEQDARFHGVALPFTDHLNLKAGFSRVLGTRKRYGMAGALRRLGLPLEGTHHRGIDDARNIAKILPFIVGAQPIPAPGEAPGQRRSVSRGADRSARRGRKRRR
ncbi:Inhibitor of the KinA pathway to sporulation, predicted exonuclease [Plesiocystis pacifica SIR-1]|uniref:Inhibitor of the KinA pathway to sporulation, predicted exonuclease n=1 Tax=Plesiocystis pacifica SIR-1 TaxID=391625 RepID=A6GC64_9BACT|nr:3'-5' exonuclease [Plesiocystis pacifica]EDM76513.1 Inhibitor of the KinA pathway to sporulation, predicted exonuclease [Plesiocystis pacifica SIR-1]